MPGRNGEVLNIAASPCSHGGLAYQTERACNKSQVRTIALNPAAVPWQDRGQGTARTDQGSQRAMPTRPLRHLLASSSLLLALVAAALPAQSQTLTIESWRNDDLDIWKSKIIPAFEKSHPG